MGTAKYILRLSEKHVKNMKKIGPLFEVAKIFQPYNFKRFFRILSLFGQTFVAAKPPIFYSFWWCLILPQDLLLHLLTLFRPSC